MTSQQYQMNLFEESEVWTLSVEDFRAKLSQLQETDEVLKIHEELCSLKLLGSHLFSNPDIYSLKTSRDSSTTTEEIPLRSSSQRWMNWGMMWNGKCLTAKILESPKIGNVCSLQGYQEAEIGDSVNLSHPNSKTRRGRVGKQIANTLLTGESQGVVEPDFRIRKLTPRECWRLQGFPDWAFDKAQEVNSNSQLYKQAGNSVTVNVIAAIAKELS
ncbi:DNA methylase [Streptococcus pneumoniae]|nr:DNA methylase [Streptococcus pneumoniae]VJB39241.1 DNA methylase [Streptococcus pneumoniae]VJN03194.1 DNA methylase [Streptococcus pneumoniae]VJP56704.1 DNA methylase [Streptococcus pneumoniae]VJS16130.1 DNA methylase [Streptococcus pneumoniae]